jgi:hypothetical protein
MKENPQKIRDWLAHPLLLLLVGSLISSYLIPSVTRQWQNHQKQLEIRTQLVGDISDAVARIITAVQFVEVGSATQSQSQFDEAFRSWEIERAILGSEIRSYYPHTDIGDSWSAFSEIVTEVYALSGTYDQTYRQQRLERIQTYLPNSSIDWTSLADLTLREGDFSQRVTYQNAWFSLKDSLLAKRDELISRILESTITPLR